MLLTYVCALKTTFCCDLSSGWWDIWLKLWFSLNTKVGRIYSSSERLYKFPVKPSYDVRIFQSGPQWWTNRLNVTVHGPKPLTFSTNWALEILIICIYTCAWPTPVQYENNKWFRWQFENMDKSLWATILLSFFFFYPPPSLPTSFLLHYWERWIRTVRRHWLSTTAAAKQYPSLTYIHRL